MALPFANVTATFEDSEGEPRANIEVLFEPLSTPYAVGDEVATSVTLTVTTDEDGEIGTQKLVQGVYNVVVSDADVFTISVPGDSATYDIADLTVNLPAPAGVAGGGVGQVTAQNVQRLFQQSRTVATKLSGDEAAYRDKFLVFGEGGGDVESLNLIQQLESPVPHLFCVGNLPLVDASANFDSWIKGANGSAVNPPFMYVAPGQTDWDEMDGLATFTAFYEFAGNERYYKESIPFRPEGTTTTWNPGSFPDQQYLIDLFVLDSNALEPDGNTQTSVQANWLRTELSSSTARWKIVMFRDAPVASKTSYSFPAMDWPFAEWGADVVLMGGAKFFQRLKKNGIWYFLVGTFGDPLDAIGVSDLGAFTNFGAVVTVGYLACDYNEQSLRFYFTTPSGSVLYDIVEVVHRDTNIITPSVQIAAIAGLKYTEVGLSLDYGVYDGGVQSGFSKFVRDSEARIIRLATVPTTGEVRANGWLKNCMFMVGDDPPVLYYWNKADSSVKPWYPEAISNASIHEGSRTQLAAPSFFDDNITIGSLVYHIDPDDPDPDVVLWVALNDGPFEPQATNPAMIYYMNPRSGATVLSAFASKTGFIDSEIATVQRMSVSDYFRYRQDV